jgi:signal peptidase II
MTHARRRIVMFVAITLVTLGLDQGSKAWARTLPVSPPGCAVPGDLVARQCAGVAQPVIDGFWDWELGFNTGVAFSSFQGSTGARVVLSLLAVLALGVIGVTAARTRPDQRLRRAALALIAGGALGNLVDRLRDGAVTDFVRWRIHDHRWPIFNVADAVLLIGVGLLVVEGALHHRRLAPG